MFNKLIWSDEFDYTGAPDPKKWGYELGASGWGNGELQSYTNSISNAFVKDGMLNVVAINTLTQQVPLPNDAKTKKTKKQQTSDVAVPIPTPTPTPTPTPIPTSAPTNTPVPGSYTSVRLVTKGKASFKYGRIEFNAKLPIGRGTWPAFWLYGTGDKYSEIDIMENVGYESQLVWFSTHSESGTANPSAHHTSPITIKDTNTAFHVYSVDWTPDYIIGYVDGVKYFSLYKKDIDPALWTFDSNMFLIINLAIGGSWGGYEGVDSSAFPQTVLVDYVRVYAYTPQ
jgi:hypothetical protein